MSDLRDAHAKGYIAKTPALQFDLQLPRKPGPDADPARHDHGNSLPLKAVEVDFAVRLVGLHHFPLRPLVRSQVRGGPAAARMGQGAI